MVNKFWVQCFFNHRIHSKNSMLIKILMKNIILICFSFFNIYNYAQGLDYSMSIGSNMQLKPYMRPMHLDTSNGNISLSNQYYDHYTYRILNTYGNFTPGFNISGGNEQATYDIITKKYGYNAYDQFAIDLKKRSLAVEEIQTIWLDRYRFYVYFTFYDDLVIRKKDTLLMQDRNKNEYLKEIGIAYFDTYNSTIPIYTKKSNGISTEKIHSVVMDEQENMYILGQYYGTFELDSLKLRYVTDFDHDLASEMQNYFLISLNKSGQIRWGKKIWVYYGNKGSLVYSKNHGLTLTIKSDMDSIYYDSTWIKGTGQLSPTQNFVMHVDTMGHLNHYFTLNNIDDYQDRNFIALLATKPQSRDIYLLSYFRTPTLIGTDSLKSEYDSTNKVYKSDIYVATLRDDKVVRGQKLNFDMYYTSRLRKDVIDFKADSGGNLYVLGEFRDSIRIGNTVRYAETAQDIFLAAFDKDSKLLWLQTGHGTKNDSAFAISLVVWRNEVTINGYVTDSFYWNGNYIDRENFRHMFIARFEVYPTGVELLRSVKQEESIQVYPNPSHDIVTVVMLRNSKTWLKLYDIHGQEVMAVQTRDVFETNLNISHLAPGVYLLKAESEHWSACTKIMKE